MKNKKLLFVPIIVFLLSALITVVAYAVLKINVCHATGSNTNPYNLIVVSISSVDDATGLNGHGDHVNDAWLPFTFNGVDYPGQNPQVFGTIINADCSVIPPATDTPVPSATPTATSTFEAFPTPTYTSTSTPTSVPTDTPTATSTDTPTSTPTATATATDPPPTPTGTYIPPTSTSTSQPTATRTPTDPPTATSTQQPTSTPTEEPTMTPTKSPVLSPTPTNTPVPPKAAEAGAGSAYPSTLLGSVFMGGKHYQLYQGVNAADGSLALPTTERGAAIYQNTIWVHRAWNSGWLNLGVGDYIVVTLGKTFEYYVVTETEVLPYGVYPKNEGFYLATCMSADGETWTGVELFHLKLMRIGMVR